MKSSAIWNSFIFALNSIELAMMQMLVFGDLSMVMTFIICNSILQTAIWLYKRKNKWGLGRELMIVTTFFPRMIGNFASNKRTFKNHNSCKFWPQMKFETSSQNLTPNIVFCCFVCCCKYLSNSLISFFH